MCGLCMYLCSCLSDSLISSFSLLLLLLLQRVEKKEFFLLFYVISIQIFIEEISIHFSRILLILHDVIMNYKNYKSLHCTLRFLNIRVNCSIFINSYVWHSWQANGYVYAAHHLEHTHCLGHWHINQDISKSIKYTKREEYNNDNPKFNFNFTIIKLSRVRINKIVNGLRRNSSYL